MSSENKDVEKMFKKVKDSLKFMGFDDRLSKIVGDAEATAGVSGIKPLTEEELDLVAGGRGNLMSGELDPAGLIDGMPRTVGARQRSQPTPKGGLGC